MTRPTFPGGRLRDFPDAIGDLEALIEPGRAGDAEFMVHGWMWCEGCERAYKVGDLKIQKTGQGWTYYEWALECATEGCRGIRYGYHPWHPMELPRALHPEYPETPVSGERYPV